MPDLPTRARPFALSVCFAAAGLASTARAELPEPADFTVEYFVTDEAGAHVRPMTADDHDRFLNRARCECGQQVGVLIRMAHVYPDTTKRFETFIGRMCDTAETMFDGEFTRCGQLAAALAPTFIQGLSQAFHPAFLAHGTGKSHPRGVGDPGVRLTGACEGEGRAGVWMCMPGANDTALCQPEEFFLGPDDVLAGLSGIPTLTYGFDLPTTQPANLSVEPGNGAVELRWNVPSSGDIHGFRVLCEEADGGASPGLDFPAPGLGDADGRHYFTAGNLCGGAPFSSVLLTAPAVTDPNTCGNGVVEAGEACDDGDDNGPDALCDLSCDLRVSPGLHALDWAHVCSDHVEFSENSVVVDGLDNGKTYNFVLVSYDQAGNPRAYARIVTATPDGSLPDLLPPPEGCACTTSPEGPGLLAMSLGTLALLALRRRR